MALVLIGILAGFALCLLLRSSLWRRREWPFENLPIACHELDLEGRFVRVNGAGCAMLGLEPGNLLGRPIWDILQPQGHSAPRELFRSLLAGAAPLQPFDREHVAGDGRRKWLRIYPRHIRDRAGRVTGLRCISLDLTETFESQAALRESEERYRRLFENIPIGLYRTSPEGRVLMANPACLRMLSYDSFDEIAGLDIETHNAGISDRGAFKADMERFGEVVGREAVIRAKDGRIVHVNESAREVRDPSGRLLYYEGTLQDITHRKRVDELLRASEERYRALFESAHDVIYAHDLNGAVTAFNRAGERLLGFSRDEALGRSVFALLDRPQRGRLRDLIATLLAGQPASPCEFSVRTRWNTRVPLEVSIRLLFESGQPVGMMGVARDITERKRWQQELERKNRQLEAALVEARQATEAKSLFLANMSHEIRTPMNGIAGMTELLLGTPLSAEQREYAEAVRNSADALLHIIGDILDLSRIEAGKMPVCRSAFSPAALVEEAARMLRVQARVNGVELRTSVDPLVPAVAVADANRIRQVLLNLGGNAVKFTGAGWIEIRLRPGSRSNGASLAFEVQDTGIGIAPEDRDRLFESFVQADNSLTRRHGGTGLGLAISRQLVNLMGGELTFDSRPGEGSTFRFTVPVKLAAATEPPRERPSTSSEEPAPAQPAANVRILLVEDVEMNRRIATRMLERLGYRADSVPNGSLAVEAVRRAHYDFVLMDVHMPEMDGFTATRRIRNSLNGGPPPVIIAMTARAMAGDREKCLAAGMDDYISKPVRMEDLRTTLDRWIRHGASAAGKPPVTSEPA